MSRLVPGGNGGCDWLANSRFLCQRHQTGISARAQPLKPASESDPVPCKENAPSPRLLRCGMRKRRCTAGGGCASHVCECVSRSERGGRGILIVVNARVYPRRRPFRAGGCRLPVDRLALILSLPGTGMVPMWGFRVARGSNPINPMGKRPHQLAQGTKQTQMRSCIARAQTKKDNSRYVAACS